MSTADPKATCHSGESLTLPALFVELQERACAMLRAAGDGATCVEFELWHDNETRRYTARLRLADDEDAPRLWVYDKRHGGFCCRSRIGCLWEPDMPRELLEQYLDESVPPDEIRRHCWEQDRQRGQRK